MNPFSLVGVAAYSQSFKPESKVLVRLTETHSDSEKSTACFENEATEEEVLCEISNNNVLNGRLRQLLSDTSRFRKEKIVRCVGLAACAQKTSIEIFSVHSRSKEKRNRSRATAAPVNNGG